MNKEEDVELLETASIDSSKNTQSISNVEMKKNAENMVTSSSPSIESKISENSSSISPFSSNSTVVGASASSPRISPESTFAATTHGMKQQATSAVVSKQELNDNKASEIKTKTENLASNPSKESNSSTKPIFLIVAFLLLVATIFLLPYSQDLFDKLFSNNKEKDIVDNITQGDLVCTMESDDNGNSYQYTETYSIQDSKVDSLDHKVLIQGDADFLKQRNNQCLLLKQNATSISGVTVSCDLSNEEMVEVQSFNLASFDLENVTTAFTEAGGVYPNASQGDDYKEVQRMMEISGYDCKIR